jgi:hypothetical protein
MFLSVEFATSILFIRMNFISSYPKLILILFLFPFNCALCRRRQLSPGVFSLTPEGYVPLMKKLDVSCIVRFNSKCYDRNVFLMNGIK